MTEEKDLTIAATDKELLPKDNSVVVNSALPDKSITADRKLEIIKAGAILTTPPVDMTTIKDAIEVVANLAGIASLPISIAISMNQNKKDHSKINVVEGSSESDTIHPELNKKIKNNNHTRKNHKKN